MNAGRSTRAVAAVLLSLQLTGCYGYAATREAPAPGESLRARLTPAGTAWLVENAGRSRETVDGTFVRAQDSALVFATWRTDLPGATQFRTSIDTLHIPQQHIAALEQRRLSVGRTALAVAGAAGILVLALSELAGIGGSGEGGRGGGVFFTAPLQLPFTR
ncbi:MAG TPA: hypothetical protein VFU06_10570 [Longimicrobiales bacterium]|nr:hypothetical protein [Longimicrobiales bacterium]